MGCGDYPRDWSGHWDRTERALEQDGAVEEEERATQFSGRTKSIVESKVLHINTTQSLRPNKRKARTDLSYLPWTNKLFDRMDRVRFLLY